MKSRRSRGTWRPGVEHPNARLTEQDVRDIRRMYFETDVTQQAIADKYNVSQAHVGKIINGIRWTCVEDKADV